MMVRLPAVGRRYRDWLGAVAVSITVVSCGDSNPSGPTTPEPSSSFAADVQPIFDAHCTNCHAIGVFGFNLTGGLDDNGLDLTPGRSHAALVGRATYQEPDVAPNLRVAPGSGPGSYLLQKLESSTPKLGKQMPLNGPFLTATQIETIRAWIIRGAPND